MVCLALRRYLPGRAGYEQEFIFCGHILASMKKLKRKTNYVKRKLKKDIQSVFHREPAAATTMKCYLTIRLCYLLDRSNIRL